MPSYTYKISQLPSAASLNNSSILPIVDGTITKKVTAQQVLNFITSSTFSNLNVLNLTGSSITGSLARFTILTGSTIVGTTAQFTILTGSTTTGSLALFTTVSGTTITGSTALFVSTTSSQAMITGDLRVLGTASITQLNTLNQTSLFIGDKYITILSGGVDHTGINGAGILWGTSSGPGETTGSLGEHAHILYNATSDGLQLFPALTVSGVNNTILFNVSGATSYFSGNVGIGTSSPATALQVIGEARATNFSDGAGNFNVNLGNGDLEGRGLVAGFSGGGYGGIGYNVRHTAIGSTFISPIADTSNYIVFSQGFQFLGDAGTTAGRTTNFAELMRITNNGNVGIGTGAPSTRLHVAGGSGLTLDTVNAAWADIGADVASVNYMKLRRPGSAIALGYIGGGGGGALSAGSQNDLAIRSDGELHLATGNSPRVTITSAGDVGIGTTSPATKLDVNGSVRVTGGSIYGQVAEITASVSTTYTLQSSDSGKLLTINNGSPVTLTVPAGLPTGFTVSVCQLGSGQITVSPSGVTINNRQSHTKAAGQYSVISIVGTAADTYVLVGDTAS